MKAQNKEEKLAKQQEREKLQREIAAREKAEKLQVEYLYSNFQFFWSFQNLALIFLLCLLLIDHFVNVPLH